MLTGYMRSWPQSQTSRSPSCSRGLVMRGWRLRFRRSTACCTTWVTALKKTLRASEQGRPDIAAKRRRWRNWQTWLRPERLVFVDETGAKTNMTRLRGRSLRGQRLHASAPWGHWQTTTFVAALRSTGLSAEMLLDGAMNKEAFKSYVEQILAPSLKPGDVVFMDNLSSHK